MTLRKTFRPRLRTTTSAYPSLVELVEESTPLAEIDAEIAAAQKQGMNLHAYRLRVEIERIEAGLSTVLRDAGIDPREWLKFLNSRAAEQQKAGLRGADPDLPTMEELAAGQLYQIAMLRAALERGNAHEAALHALGLGTRETLATILAMELSFQIGEKQRLSRGITKQEIAAMQRAADLVWRSEPRASMSSVARHISPQFPRWPADTIRKKIKRR